MAANGRYRLGGRGQLLRLVEEHPTEAVADFRAIFGCSLFTLPAAEALHLLKALLSMPESRLRAAAAGWTYPVTREWTAIMNLLDAFNRANSKRGKAQPQPRPWPDQTKTKIGGRNKKRTPSEVWRTLYGRDRE